ncbi:SprT-like domain-containing protein [Lacibacter sp. MH-610]|uniref:SprT-like domain-containing protein n=1 Tax=Lacibacter sp. MH-610 TaxID=3020883 RepID=UPI003892A6D8
MAKKEVPLHALAAYMPKEALEPVLHYLHQYKIHLTITRERNSVLGDYRHAVDTKNHRISVNGNLNQYAFLVTLLHEIAHLLTFEQFGNRIAPHGKEWKNEYSKILARFLLKKVFPADVEKALLRSIQNPSATSCGEEHLIRVLKNYDERKPHEVLVEELTTGQLFKLKDGRVFQKGEKLRKRHKAVDVKTGAVYLFSGVYEVERVEKKVE